ncbi:hypothetical protein AC1031_002165 [Aphanomyces cochlioides]|nr:hypothetical protein AC1031_002165 [Aphanomyces cochlioides]
MRAPCESITSRRRSISLCAPICPGRRAETVWISIEPVDAFNCSSPKVDKSMEAITKSLGDVKMEQTIPHHDLFVFPGQQIPHWVEKFPGYVALIARPDPNQSDPAEGSREATSVQVKRAKENNGGEMISSPQ